MTDPDTVKDLHAVAMFLAQDAYVYDQKKSAPPSVTRIMRREAARLERMAIAEVDRYAAETGKDAEPTRRILTISAISLENHPMSEEDVMRLYEEEVKAMQP